MPRKAKKKPVRLSKPIVLETEEVQRLRRDGEVHIVRAIAAAQVKCGTIVLPFSSPLGQFWVRELYAPRYTSGSESAFDRNRRYIKYYADDPTPSPCEPGDWHLWPEAWQQASRMPKWASRCEVALVTVAVTHKPRWEWNVTLVDVTTEDSQWR